MLDLSRPTTLSRHSCDNDSKPKRYAISALKLKSKVAIHLVHEGGDSWAPMSIDLAEFCALLSRKS